MRKTFVFGFAMLQITSLAICQPTSTLPKQVENIAQTQGTQLQEATEPLLSEPLNCTAKVAQKYVSSRQVDPTQTGTNLLNQATDTTKTLSSSQPLDTISEVVQQYASRQIAQAESFTNQAATAANSLPVPPVDTITNLATKYTTRQVAQSESQSQAASASASINTTLPNQVPLAEAANTLTNQVGNVDPIALTERIYQTLEQHFGTLGPVLFDLITSPEALGEEFIPATMYAAQQVGPESIRNAVNAVVNLASEVDWRARMQPLFDRVADLRDAQTGLTLQDAYQVVRNIFENPQLLEQLRERIRDDNGITVSESGESNEE